MSKRLHNQGGAIRSFVIIAIILAVATVAAIYFVQKRGEQVRREQAIAAADQLAKDQKASNDKKTKETPTSTPAPGSSTPSVVPTEVSELPATGSELSLLQACMGAILVGVMVAYLDSRRRVTSSPLT